MKKAIVFLVLFVAAIGYAMAQTANVASVTQTGCNQKADVAQYGEYNNAIIEQSTMFDETNEGIIYQSGNYNEGKIEQVHTGSFGSAHQRVDLFQMGDENKSDSYQEGFEQFANIRQYGNEGDVKTYQEGFENLLDVRQYSTAEKVDATQMGSYHYAYLYQDGPNSEMTTLQEGSHNRIFIWQWVEDKASVTQDGHFNYTEIDQYWATLSEAKLTQLGEENLFLLEQEGANNYAEVYEKGFFNEIRLYQNGDGYAVMSQDGISNIVKGLGPDLWVKNLNGSELYTTQVGDYNVIEVFQAAGEKATVGQFGCNNNAVVNQN